MGRRNKIASKDYREAIRKANPVQYVNCPKCGLETERKDNSDAYICTRCSKVFVVTDDKTTG